MIHVEIRDPSGRILVIDSEDKEEIQRWILRTVENICEGFGQIARDQVRIWIVDWGR